MSTYYYLISRDRKISMCAFGRSAGGYWRASDKSIQKIMSLLAQGEKFEFISERDLPEEELDYIHLDEEAPSETV